MSVLIPLLLLAGSVLLLRLSTGLAASRRLALLLVSLALILIPLPAAFELGRTWDAHRREAAAGRTHRKEPIGSPALATTGGDPSDPDSTDRNPPAISIRDCRDPELDLAPDRRRTLTEAGMTRVAMPFGVLLAADERMPLPYVRQAAAVLAEMLDQDLDGAVDDPTLVELLADHSTAWLAMPYDEEEWERRQLPILERTLGYDIVIPAWWLDPVPDGPDDHGRAVIVEEIHHFITQFGLSRLHPNIFGVDDWNSVIARETARAKCDFWQHPENDCPGRPAQIPGDCEEPNCDVVEFYHQVVVLRAGMEPGWRGIGFPETPMELEKRLGPEIKAVMEDPRHHQIRAPLRFDYPVLADD